MSSTKPTIIVTGGAGYLGYSACKVLEKAGYHPIILDNFSTSQKPSDHDIPIFDVDLSDYTKTQEIWLSLGKIHAVMHFAAKALVPESCEKPEAYFRNNMLATLNVAELCIKTQVKHFVHSSSCAVYGTPTEVPIHEESSCQPISPYGETKMQSERILYHLHGRNGFQAVNLRYFNPAGAIEINGQWFGEHHYPETHLIPMIVNSALSGQAVPVFGMDYATNDGSCVRDFIHVEDLIHAHILALRWLENGTISSGQAVNLGAGHGISVLEAVNKARTALKIPIEVCYQSRRFGDPPILFADISKAKRLLNWQPTRTIEEMILSHCLWKKSRDHKHKNEAQL